MSNYATLKAAVQAVVKSNGNKEITGTNMQSTLLGMITSLASGYLFKGVCTPSTAPGSPDENVFYIGGAGTYANFGTSVTVPVGSIGVFRYNGSWSSSQIKIFDGIDSKPTAGSSNFVESGGVADLFVEQPFLGRFVADREHFPFDGAYSSDGSFSKTGNRRLTPFIKVDESVTITYRLYGLNGTTLAIIAFDGEKNIITGKSKIESNNTPLFGTYVCDSTVRYVRLSARNDLPNSQIYIFGNSVGGVMNNASDVWQSLEPLYTDDISEIYIPIKIDGARLAYCLAPPPLTGHSNRLVFDIRDSSNTSVAKCDLNDVIIEDGKVYGCVCTSSTDSGFVGKVIAYILFKNSAHFLSNNTQEVSARYDMINYNNAINPINSPKIQGMFSDIQYDKIQFPAKLTADYLSQNQYIDEIYLVMPLDNNSAGVTVRFNSNRVIINEKAPVPRFVGIKYMTGYSDGQVIPVNITTSRDEEAYPTGTLIGYVIVNDIAGAGAKLDTHNEGNYITDLKYVYRLENAPKIAAYLSNLDNPIAPSPDETASIVIPDTINAVVGDTLQLFFKSVVKCPNYKDYGIVAACSIGKSYPRYYEVTPVAGDIGSKSLTIMVYGEGMKVVAQKQVTLNVIAQATSPSTNKNILLVAASTFASGVIMPEVKRRLTGTGGTPSGLGLSNISFIGRKEVDGVHQEATGGYSWQTYATDAFKSHRFYVSGVSAVTLDATYTIEGVPIPSGVGYLVVKEVNITEGTGNILCEVYGGAVYPQGSIPASGTLVKRSGTGDDTISYSSQVTEDGNPFWYNGDIDFSYYSATYCGGADIDVLIAHLGLNGFSSTASVDLSIENYVKPFIRKFHEDYPSGIFLLGTLQLGSPNGGYASVGYANATQNWYNISKTYWYAVEKYQELAQDAEFSSYVIVGNITPEYDCEYGYPTTEKKVNIRSSEEETIQTNQIHPTNDGKLLLADSIYRDLTNIL